MVLHGHSGSGKSTLLRSLYANYLPDEGQIQIKHGEEWVDLVTAPARKVVEIRKTTIGWVSQFLRVIPRISALEVVMQPLLDTGVPREACAAMCRARHIALASHDDATHAHVAQSHQLGSVIAEFPTTFEAAEASRKHGMNVLMGAPNIVRGGSHSGNVAASELAQLGLLDILSSDYYPASLLDAAFRVADDESNRFTLPQAVKLVTKNPAQALNLQDCGVIGEGKRADLVLAHRKGNHIHIDHVWRQGKRVF
ncbi:TPA: ATP-binding cassette domain-containing protein [Escherichia coli]|nr:ATP-binding cassette domain-containing protein [Escherichia coli]